MFFHRSAAQHGDDRGDDGRDADHDADARVRRVDRRQCRQLYISRQLGAGQRDQVSRIVQTTMTLVVLISIVLPILFITFLGPLLGMFGAEGDVTMYAAQYVTILLVFAFSQIIKLTIVHLLRAEGDVNFPMAAIFAGVVANLILDPIFMFDWGLNLGIAGAAWRRLRPSVCRWSCCWEVVV